MGTRGGGWGDGEGGWFLGEDGTPCPSLPCPDHCLLPAWAPLESNLQSDTHTQRGRVWGRAPKRAKKQPLPEKNWVKSPRNEHNVKPAKFLPTDPGAGSGEGENSSIFKKPQFQNSEPIHILLPFRLLLLFRLQSILMMSMECRFCHLL